MNLSGSPFDYLIAFFGGVLLSFTPCVYPLIPISASFIAGRATGSKLKGLILGLVYVAGVAVTYSALGLVASLSGRIFGEITSHPVTYFFVGGVVILFGLSMLDLFTLPLPNFIRLPKTEKKSYFSAFLLGLSSGLVMSPCLTPVLGAILVYLAVKKNILYGTTLLFSFAYGTGFIIIIIATFTTALAGLPKSGKWMLLVKRICAFILIGMGIYFISTGIRNL